MDLLWPGFLALLLLVPGSVGVYVWALGRRPRRAARYSSLALVHAALPGTSRLRRHLPFALFALAIGGLAIAMARPVVVIPVPTGQTTVILAIDVSRSMCQTDIVPSRLQAAESAASSFVQRQGPGTQIGIVAFAGFGELIVPPTSDDEVLLDAIASLTTGRRTAIGSGILKSLDAIAEIDPSVAPSVTDTTPGTPPAPVPAGAYAPDIVVVLTDGVSNAGPEPIDAAQQATDRGVRVYTIGFGTADPQNAIPVCGPGQTGREPLGGFGGGFGGGQLGGGGGGFRRGIDEDTLKQVADMTGGSYYSAESAGELEKVFAQLPTNIITKHEVVEISVAFAALGTLLFAASLLLGQRWRPLP